MTCAAPGADQPLCCLIAGDPLWTPAATALATMAPTGDGTTWEADFLVRARPGDPDGTLVLNVRGREDRVADFVSRGAIRFETFDRIGEPATVVADDGTYQIALGRNRRHQACLSRRIAPVSDEPPAADGRGDVRTFTTRADTQPGSLYSLRVAIDIETGQDDAVTDTDGTLTTGVDALEASAGAARAGIGSDNDVAKGEVDFWQDGGRPGGIDVISGGSAIDYWTNPVSTDPPIGTVRDWQGWVPTGHGYLWIKRRPGSAARRVSYVVEPY